MFGCEGTKAGVPMMWGREKNCPWGVDVRENETLRVDYWLINRRQRR